MCRKSIPFVHPAICGAKDTALYATKEVSMLKLSLTPGEYLTIGENIVVQVYRSESGRAYLAIDAPREVPVVRGAVREREGGQRPDKLAQARPKGHRSLNPV